MSTTQEELAARMRTLERPKSLRGLVPPGITKPDLSASRFGQLVQEARARANPEPAPAAFHPSVLAPAEELERAPNLPVNERVQVDPLPVHVISAEGVLIQFPGVDDLNQRIPASADGVTPKDKEFVVQAGGNATDIRMLSIDVPNQVRLYVDKDGERWLYFRGPKSGEIRLEVPVRFYRELKLTFSNYNTFEMDAMAFINMTRPFGAKPLGRGGN